MRFIYGALLLLGPAAYGQTITADTLWTRDLSSVEAFSVAFSPDGERIAVSYSCHGPMVRIFETATGNVSWESGTPDLCLYAVRFSSTGEYIAIAEELGHLTVFNMSTMELAYNIDTETGGLTSVDFTPDGGQIIAGCVDGKVRIYNTQTGLLAHTLGSHSGSVLSVAISEDGQRIASGGSDDRIEIFDGGGTFIRELTGHSGDVKTLRFMPWSHTLISGSADDAIKIWNTETGNEDAEIDAHWADVNVLDISRDGTFMASGSNDMTIRIFDLFDRQELISLTNDQQTRVYGVAISPDQTKIAAGVQNGAVMLWNIAGAVSLPGTDHAPSLLIYPNPTHDRISFGGPAENSVALMDMSGKLVIAAVNRNSISLESLASGSYILQVSAGGKTARSLVIRN